MKKLNNYMSFNFNEWQKHKKFMIQGVRYNERKLCVTLDVVIVEDGTDYGDPAITNLFEKFKVHCVQDTQIDDVNKYSPRDSITFKQIGKCTVWGDYNTNLSCEAVVEVIKP